MTAVPWYQAPLPRRLHRCTPWTTGHIGTELIARCACGAILTPYGWAERNSRRRRRKPPRPTGDPLAGRIYDLPVAEQIPPV